MNVPSAALPVAFSACIAMATWDEIKNKIHVPPYPQRYVGIGVAFGMLGILDGFASELAGVLALGLVLGMAYMVTGGSNTKASTPPANSPDLAPPTGTEAA